MISDLEKMAYILHVMYKRNIDSFKTLFLKPVLNID